MRKKNKKTTSRRHKKSSVHKSTNSHIKMLLVIFFVLLAVLGILLFVKSKSIKCANENTCLGDLSGKYHSEEKEAIFMNQKINIPQYIAQSNFNQPVLGETNKNVDKHIYVDLTNQMLYAYEDGKTVMSFSVSTGKWNRTPTGDFRIWVKLRYTRMSGGNPAIGTYYDLPNVPYVMFFSNDQISKGMGYSLHGTYWHNNFGHPMSHGCINMRIEEAMKLYNWANPSTAGSTTYASTEDPGTPITIYGTAPNS